MNKIHFDVSGSVKTEGLHLRKGGYKEVANGQTCLKLNYEELKTLYCGKKDKSI